MIYIIYNKENSTWSGLNNLHDGIWINENLTRGTIKISMWYIDRILETN
jgi:hypothetical protein